MRKSKISIDREFIDSICRCFFISQDNKVSFTNSYTCLGIVTVKMNGSLFAFEKGVYEEMVEQGLVKTKQDI